MLLREKRMEDNRMEDKRNTAALNERNAVKSRGRKRRRNRAVAMFICLTVMVAVMYGTVTLCMWIADKMKEPSPVSGNAEGSRGGSGSSNDGVEKIGLDENGNVVDADGNVIGVLSDAMVYSQAEMEAQVTGAREQATADVLEGIRTKLNDGDSIMETLRPLYPDDLIVYSGGQYHFVPINRSLKQSQLDETCLNVLESGEYQYIQDGQVISHKGIDVSKHQGTIDWQMVAQDGVEFAFIRVGFRGYETGKLVEDEFFEANITGAIAAGIKVGVYFYSQAVDETEVREEAEFVLEKIAPYKIDCPVVFDVEKAAGNGRMNGITVEERTGLTQLFCTIIENAGYRPMIYYNMEMGALMLGLEALEDYDKWFAAYSDRFYYPYAYKIWQYSQNGTVQGINGDVDLNISFGPPWEE